MSRVVKPDGKVLLLQVRSAPEPVELLGWCALSPAPVPAPLLSQACLLMPPSRCVHALPSQPMPVPCARSLAPPAGLCWGCCPRPTCPCHARLTQPRHALSPLPAPILQHGRGTWSFINSMLDKDAQKHHDKWGCWWNRDILGLLEQVRGRWLHWGLWRAIWTLWAPPDADLLPAVRPCAGRSASRQSVSVALRHQLLYNCSPGPDGSSLTCCAGRTPDRASGRRAVRSCVHTVSGGR